MGRFTDDLKSRVAKAQKKIVLPETNSRRVLKAAERVLAEGFAKIILVGNLEQIKKDAAKFQIDLTGVEVIDPATYPRLDQFAAYLAERRKKKGMTVEQAKDILLHNNTFFGAALVAFDVADGMVSGAATTSAEVIRAGLQVIGPRPGNKTVSSAFILITNTPQYGDNGILVLGDCGVIPEPTAEQLADIACICVERARTTVQILDPKVAFLSYSTKGSGSGDSVDKVRKAVEILKERNVDFDFDGEMQADAALVPDVGEGKAPGSKVAGHANVLIFPSLDAANIGYKMVQRFANATALGPLVQGLAKPILDLSRGCSSDDVADVVAVCCSDAISTEIFYKTHQEDK
ncbi:MAG: phosphate acetyltransferase [Megasphaera sp.]|jgi:phosphate acetyltransferase|uniref:phosphate acetyltransferase n=1 Tax=Megasphaera sueciensis TaxID=349094 RepID=UPI003CFE6B2E|nr:phosphate acetyltransferase [Megasphaera sp.]MCI1822809.1 phosphate acetyltransferase [Megasphaera sp.]